MSHLSARGENTSSMCVREPIASSAVSALQWRTARRAPQRASMSRATGAMPSSIPIVPTRSTAPSRCASASSGAASQSRLEIGCSASHHRVAASSSAVPTKK